MKKTALFLIASAALAQGPGPRMPGDRDRPQPREFMRGPEQGPQRQPGLQGRWWSNPDMIRDLNITADQQKKMDEIFQQNRLRVVDLTAALRKDEIILEPLMFPEKTSPESSDESKLLAQIDKVSQARAELEKSQARFLFAIRRTLNPDQWNKLQDRRPPPERGEGPNNRPDRRPEPDRPGPRDGRL